MRRRSMYSSLIALLVLTGAPLSAEEKCVADVKEPVELFNGKDLSGWSCFLVDANAKMEDVWSVKDGILICKGEPHGYLATENRYENFKLIVEWRWAPGKEPGNSGVLMRITGEEMMLPNCVEAQLKSGDAGAMYGFQGFKIDGPAERKTETKGHKLGGDLTGLKKLEAAENTPPEWNRYEITASGDKIAVKVNGKKVNEAFGCDVRCGKIAVQSEGGEIHFRKISLQPVN